LRDELRGTAGAAEVRGRGRRELLLPEAAAGELGLPLSLLGERGIGPALPASLRIPDRLGVAQEEQGHHGGSVNHPVDIIGDMERPAVLVSVELRFLAADDPEQLGERIREAVRLIVGSEALEDFRIRSLPLTEPPEGRIT
jgi:hypothetical protein